MSYIQPDLVLSPKGMVEELSVIIDTGEEGWSLSKMKWDGNPVLAIRWNGGSKVGHFPGIGNPQSRGVPTWFVLPDEVGAAIIENMVNQVKIYLETDLPKTLVGTGILRVEQVLIIDSNENEYDNQYLVNNAEFRTRESLVDYVANKLGIQSSIIEIVDND